MGLDMYLTAKKHTYLSPYENDPDYVPHRKRDALENAICDIQLPEAFDPYGSRTFECTALYWRKANAIHQWFVDKVQNGEDNCGSYSVSHEQLTDLRDTLREVMADMGKAKELLPPQEGFFFGSTDYDEWYWQDIEYTEKKLSAILRLPDLDTWYFEYQASW